MAWRMERTALTIATRALDLRARAIDADVATKVAAKPREAVPFEFQADAVMESEPWAREQSLDAIKDLHEEYQDWDTVRRLVHE